MRRISLCAWLGSAIIAAASLHSHAAGLGRLEVKSVLGEPLRAEVSVSADATEISSLRARIASPAAYEGAGLVYTGLVSKLSLTLKKDPGTEPVLLITSAGPINEPVVDLLLELSWSSGKVVRDYTAFIDPPFIVAEREQQRVAQAAEETDPGAETQPASVPDAPTPQPLDEPPAEAPTVSEPTQYPDEVAQTPTPAPSEDFSGPVETIGGSDPTLFTAAPVVSSARDTDFEQAVPYAAGDSIKVKRGDTLSKIALANKPAGVTLEQMLVVLYRNNPQAFSGSNMNRLRTGRIIKLPDPDEYSQIGAGDARKEVRIQSADWNAYRERLAAVAMQQPAGQEQPAQQSAGGMVKPKVDDQAPTPAQKAPEVVKLSKGEPGSSAGTGGKAEVQALQEKLVASEKALKDQTDRVERLEKIIADLQKLAEVKSQDMAKVQAQAAASKEAAKAGEASMPAAGTQPVAPKPVAETEPKPVGSVPAPPPSPGDAGKEEPQPQQPGVAQPQVPASPEAGSPTPVPAAPESKTAQPQPPAQQNQRRRPPPPPPPPSLLDRVMEQPYLLAVPVVVLLLIGFGVSKLRGRKKREPKASPDEVAPAALATAASGGDSSRGTYSPTDTDVGLASTKMGGSDEVDPLEEAEIFLAYGRDAQAEELLKEALQHQPKRYEIHGKLAEIYHKRRDAKAFDGVAREAQQGTGGSGEVWNRIVTLGYDLDPQNPRYAEGRSSDTPSVGGPAASSAPAADLDFDVGLGNDTDTGTAPDFDPSATSEFTPSQIFDPDATFEANFGSGIDAPTMNVRSEESMTSTDLDLNVDIPELGSALNDADPEATNTVDFDIDLGGMGVDSPIDVGADEPASKGEDSGLDFNVDDFSIDTGGATEPLGPIGTDEASVPAIDLSGISLDLDGATTSQLLSGSGKDDKWYEVQTKFDLAKAYQEMGDKDGAREILQEVMAEGDAEQKAAAETVLSSLD